MKDALVFLKHMRDAVTLIQEFTKGYSKEKFLDDQLVQSAVIPMFPTVFAILCPIKAISAISAHSLAKRNLF